MIEKHNFHWREGFFYDFPKKRNLLNDLINEIKTKQIISLIGLRRTGKTTILKQLIDHLIKSEKIKREHILFYSFDEEQPKIEEIIHEYETKLGKEVLKIKDKIYVFLDEIQKLENWQNQIKYYYDNYANIKFFISGSASLFIKKHTLESLAGRIYEFTLKPLSFREFLIFKDKEEMIKKPGLFQESIKKEFLAYQKRQFIETINESEEKTGQYVKTMIEKIVYQDIPKIFPVENQELLLKILKVIASNPGMLSDYDSLSNELGTNRVTLSNYFYYLEESFLIKKIYNFSKNRLTSEKKMKKLYLNTTSFFPFLNDNIDEAKLIENLIVITSGAKFFWRTPQKYEVDIILDKNNKILPIEAKYKEHVTGKDLKNLLRFCEKFNAKEAVIITKNKDEKKEFKKNEGKITIKFIPAWKFCLGI
ncbi:MAG: ATP-binding protein [Candidatus Pacearchaeota archaeon]|nr:ATP-binding protein [Candidatus Pacearchaeota archaeon]